MTRPSTQLKFPDSPSSVVALLEDDDLAVLGVILNRILN